MSIVLREKLMQSKTLLKRVFIHEEYYIDSLLASFASDAHICLLGYRGGGKTHLCESLLKMIDPKITSTVQGYLTAEIEDVFARPDISKLIKGDEEVIFKKTVYSRVKFYDEIQRLGVGALSTMFRLMTKGTVVYMDREEGVKPFWVLATANPSEVSNDTLNIVLPEPLWDRFDGVIWITTALGKFKYSIEIDEKIERLKDALPLIWTEKDILELWKEVDGVEITEDIKLIVTMLLGIMSFCQYAQDYDASSLTEEIKREQCSKCSKTYTCSMIARPPSVRAKMSLLRLAKGFAYLRGSNKVELIDLEKAFPLVFWKRIRLMNEELLTDRLSELKALFDKLKTEIVEVKEAIELINKLKEKYDERDYRRLRSFVNAKIWFKGVVEILDEHYAKLKEKLMEKYVNADLVQKAKIYMIAKSKLPIEYLREFYENVEVNLPLDAKTLAKFSSVDKNLFIIAKERFERGETSITLDGDLALRYIAVHGEVGQ
jgi:MoxR-like ATPase